MDEPAVASIRKKRRSSMRICADLVKAGRAQAMVTAGNTGAAMMAAKMVFGTVAGVDRPALAASCPRGGAHGADRCRRQRRYQAGDLRQFGVMGALLRPGGDGQPQPPIGLIVARRGGVKGDRADPQALTERQPTGLNSSATSRGATFTRRTSSSGLRRLRRQRGARRAPRRWRSSSGACSRGAEKVGCAPCLGYLFARPAFDALRRRTDYPRVRGGAAARHRRRLLHRPRPLQRQGGAEQHPPGGGRWSTARGPRQDPRQDGRAARSGRASARAPPKGRWDEPAARTHRRHRHGRAGEGADQRRSGADRRHQRRVDHQPQGDPGAADRSPTRRRVDLARRPPQRALGEGGPSTG